VEFLQAFFLVADDIMDHSETRRGQPCWFRKPTVNMIAINDSFILESCVFILLKRYFGRENYYPQLVDLFIETTRQTELGQLLDLTSQPQGGQIDLSRFTLTRYTSIVKYKTAFYTFYLPVALGMVKAGLRDKVLYDNARDILCAMGEYFQVQDDFLDCYGKPEVIGKIGTDIQDNKCSWLVVQALNVATIQQKRVLTENYGQKEPEKVERVKDLYAQMRLPDIFEKYEEQSYKTINLLIDGCPEIPREVFDFLLKKIYKRSK
jgi:farnesyl diphosphate synthase